MEFDYEIIYSKKRKKTISVEIKEAGVVIVSAPMRTSQIEIEKILTLRKSWILKKINSSKKREEGVIDILKQKQTFYFGEKIDVEIKESKLLMKKGFCEFENEILTVFIPEIIENKNDFILKTIFGWYKSKAQIYMKNRTIEFVKKHNLVVGNISVKRQKKIWGSCDSKNNIRYNWRIIMANKDVVDYLIAHELAHTIEKNHSKRFWNHVEEMLPNYRKLRKEIKNSNHLLAINI